MTLQEMLTALKASVKKYEAAKSAFDSVATDADEKVRGEAKTVADTARDEMAKLTSQVESATVEVEAMKKAAGAAGRADDMLKVDVRGKSLTGYRDAKDEDEGEAVHLEKFMKYVEGGRSCLSSADLDVLQPKSQAFKTQDAQMGVVLPKRVVARILGSVYAQIAGWHGAEKAMRSSSGLAGGFTVPEDFRAMLIEAATEAPALLPLCTVLPTTTGEITIPRLKQTDANEYGGVTAAWTSEGGEKSYQEAEFEQVKINAHELSAYTEVTLRLLSRSALNLEVLLARLFRAAILDIVDSALLQGTGTGQPYGILNTAGVRAVARTTGSTVVYEDLVNLKYALKPYHRAGGVFVIEDAAVQKLELKKDGEERPLFTASTANGIYDRLVGRNYVPTTRLPAVGSAGDVLFGDPREYYVAMEQEVVVKRSDDYKFRNNVAAFAMFMVVGGQPVIPRTWAYLQGNS